MFDLGYGTACLDMLARVSAHWPRRSVLWHGMLYGNASGACWVRRKSPWWEAGGGERHL